MYIFQAFHVLHMEKNLLFSRIKKPELPLKEEQGLLVKSHAEHCTPQVRALLHVSPRPISECFTHTHRPFHWPSPCLINGSMW